MLIRAPWFVYELPAVNALYHEDVIDPCFEGQEPYRVDGRSIEVDIEYAASHHGSSYRCVTRGHFRGFDNFDTVELTIVTKESGLYHELPVPAPDGLPAWLLLSAYQVSGKWYYWGEGATGSIHCTNIGEIVPLLTLICEQIATKLKPQKN